MRLVSPFLKHALYPALHHSGILRRLEPPGDYTVVNYHGVLPSDHSHPDLFLDGNLVRPQALRKQLQFLKTHYHVIHPEKFREAIERDEPIAARTVLVTCDDGLLNVLTDMLPILQSENVPCLFFVTGASCSEQPPMLFYEELYQLMRNTPLSAELQLADQDGTAEEQGFQALWWQMVRRASRLQEAERAEWMSRVRAQCGTPARRPSEKRTRLLKKAELNRLIEAGMSVGAHTLTHPILSLCNEEQARREIANSKLELEQATGQKVWAFAYPYGNSATMGEREVRMAEEAGFTCAFLNVEHWDGTGSSSFTIPRVHVGLRTTLPEFAAHLSGFHNRLQRAAGG